MTKSKETRELKDGRSWIKILILTQNVNMTKFCIEKPMCQCAM